MVNNVDVVGQDPDLGRPLADVLGRIPSSRVRLGRTARALRVGRPQPRSWSWPAARGMLARPPTPCAEASGC